jgi:apolipoprotein D and lipocalin family protein
MTTLKTLVMLCAAALLTACSLMPAQDFPRENSVDVDRYMGKWYVIAHIPPSKTKNAYNSIETYTQTKPGVVDTVFTGYVLDEGNGAVWGMQIYWPLRLQYVISYVDDDYDTTIVAREKRDVAWVMARTPQIDDATYDALVQKLDDYGYDISELRKVPQQPPDERNDG